MSEDREPDVDEEDASDGDGEEIESDASEAGDGEGSTAGDGDEDAIVEDGDDESIAGDDNEGVTAEGGDEGSTSGDTMGGEHELEKAPGDGEASEVDGEMLDFVPDDDDILDESAITASEKKEKSPEEYKRDFTKNQLEAVLFVAGQALSAEEIAMKLGMSKKVAEDLLDTLAMEYLDRSTSLEIAKIAEKYILQLKPEFTSSVKSFASGGLIREAVMRTLTIIAAKQPILQSDLSKIRSAAGEHLKEMLDMGLVRATPKGRSRELTTTDKFADMFGFSRDVAKMKEQIKVYLTASAKDDE